MPWVFPPTDYTYSFVESNAALREQMNRCREYTTYKTVGSQYRSLVVPVNQCFAPHEETDELGAVDGIITAVGPRNILSLKDSLATTTAPVLCFENDASVPSTLAVMTGHDNFYFAIPDVITSNTAPDRLLRENPLNIVTEDGVCFADEGASALGGLCTYVSPAELHRQWLAKLYIHNTPHCIAAYLGSLCGVAYLHEALQNRGVVEVVAGAMSEMERLLVERFRLDAAFVGWYRDKEMRRFGNTLLFDPISRVAREPFRKLAPNDRLVGAGQMCLSAGIVPSNVLVGIMAAFCYENPNDPDSHIRLLMSSLDRSDFLRIVVGLNTGEALFSLLCQMWDQNLEKLRSIKSCQIPSL